MNDLLSLAPGAVVYLDSLGVINLHYYGGGWRKKRGTRLTDDDKEKRFSLFFFIVSQSPALFLPPASPFPTDTR